MNNIHLFTGQNDFERNRELQHWKHQFIEKHGDINLLTLEGGSLKLPKLLDQTSSSPFLGDKRLVIVETVPKFEKEDFETIVGTLHEDCILLFVDGAPDKRRSFAKLLLSMADVKTFMPLKQPQLLSWTKTKAAELGLILEPQAASLLLQLLSGNQSIIHDQLYLFSVSHQERTIAVDDIYECVLPLGSEAGWKLFDYIGEGKRAKVLDELRKLETFHENVHGLWTRLIWWASRVLLVHSMMKGGVSASKEIAAATGIHPFSLRSMMPLAKRLTTPQAQELSNWLLKQETGIKTGKVRATLEAPEELQSVLDQAVLLLTVQ